MARIAFVVADQAAMTAGETPIQTLLQNAGHTVTLVNDESAIATGVDLHLIGEAGSPANLATKYTGLTVPVVSCEVGGWDDLSWANANAANFGSGTDWDLNSNVPDITAGVGAGNPVNMYTSAGRFGITNVQACSGAVPFATFPGSATSYLGFAIEVGAALFSGNALARGVGLAFIDNATDALTTDGNNLLLNAIDWALSYRPRGVHHTTQYNGFY